jgi:hypothetical protein
MTSDEVDAKLKEPIKQSLPTDPNQWSKSSDPSDHSVDRCKSMDKSARAFNDIWKTGDASCAKDIMTKDVKIYDPVFGNKTEGVESFEKMIDGYSKAWKTHSNSMKVACTHSDKAFLWWQSTGSPKDDESKKDTLYGINMLVFDKDNKICTVVGFRQPTMSESDSKVKPEVQRS